MVNIWQLLKESLNLYQKNLFSILKAIAVLMVLQIATMFLPPFSGLPSEWRIFSASAIFAFVFLIGAWVDQMLIRLIYFSQDAEKLSFLEAAKQSLRRLPNYVFVLVIWWIVVGVGFALFLVPGFILMTWYSLTMVIFVAEGVGGWEAFKRSRAWTRGLGWPIFGRLIFSGFIFVAIFSALSAVFYFGLGQFLNNNQLIIAENVMNVLISRLAAPFLSAVLVVLYQEAKRLKS